MLLITVMLAEDQHEKSAASAVKHLVKYKMKAQQSTTREEVAPAVPKDRRSPQHAPRRPSRRR